MQFEPILPNTLISGQQKAVVMSALVLKGLSQGEWSVKAGLHRSELSRMLNGKLVTRQPYARKLNALVRQMHPVQMAA